MKKKTNKVSQHGVIDYWSFNVCIVVYDMFVQTSDSTMIGQS